MLSSLRKGLRALFRRDNVDTELGEELRFHFDKQVEKLVQSGMPVTEARRRARLIIGGFDLIEEECRDVRSTHVVDMLLHYLRFSFRSIVRTPMQTFLIVATLGLAMGAVLAVFSLFDKLVMRPLPVAEPSELESISAPQPEPFKQMSGGGMSGQKPIFPVDYPFFKDLRDRVQVFEGMSAHMRVAGKLATSGDSVRAQGLLVTGDYFDLLGIKAQPGRTLTPKDDLESDGDTAVVLTYGFWQRQFGGDPSVLHRTIRLNKKPMVVVGITTPGFTGTGSWKADFFAPLNQAQTFLPIRGFRYDMPGYLYYSVMARLAPGVDTQQAERATEEIYRRLLLEIASREPLRTAKDRNFYRVSLYPAGYASVLPSDLPQNRRSPLKLLMAMVALVLVVAAGNVANLLLARRTARARETAIRFALGSSRGRILRELLGESLLISAIAAIVGHFLASWTAHLVPVLLGIPNLPEGVSTEANPRYNLFAIGLAFVIGISIWGASAMRATKRSLLPALIENAAVGCAPRATHWRRGMVVLQISFSLILLCASAVLCRSLMNLMSVDPGFSVDNLYSFSIDYGELEYKGARAEALLNQITGQLRATTGVRMVAITDTVPPPGGANIRHVNDRPIPMDDKGTRAVIVAIGPDYFKTMGIPLTAGREFTHEDKAAGGRIAVINESVARILYGTANPIGRRIWVGGDSADREIVGLVKDMKGISVRSKESPSIYLPVSFGSVSFVVRTAGSAVSLVAISDAVKKVDPSLQVIEFASVADRVSESLYRDRAFAILSLCFAGLASVLCAIGVFGLTSYSIAGRTKEIGVRIALGANSGSIYKLVMREIALLSFLGCSIGLGVFIAVKQIFASMLFQLTPTDPISLGWAILILGLTTFFAGFIPSRRAAKLDPTIALRWE